MAKNKKRKKAPPQNPPSGYKKFVKDFLDIMWKHKIITEKDCYGPADYRALYNSHVNYKRSEASNDNVPKQVVAKIDRLIRQYYYQPLPDMEGKSITTQEAHMIMTNMRYVSNIVVKDNNGDKKHPESQQFLELTKRCTDQYYSQLFYDIMRACNQCSNPVRIYYGFETPKFENNNNTGKIGLVHKVNGYPVHKKHFRISGILRPAYRLGNSYFEGGFEWISIKASQLTQSHPLIKKELPVYIQSHAIQRMKERLDILDKGGINHTLLDNTLSFDEIQSFKNYYLLPIQVHNIKTGYLFAQVVQGYLLFKTFLFITHSCTPEGDKLRAITGLSKHDINYWRIDRLSAFINFDWDKNPKLSDIFRQAGLGELEKLRHQDFSTTKLQESSFQGLTKFLLKGKELSLN